MAREEKWLTNGVGEIFRGKFLLFGQDPGEEIGFDHTRSDRVDAHFLAFTQMFDSGCLH